jgi:hypothetical protein
MMMEETKMGSNLQRLQGRVLALSALRQKDLVWIAQQQQEGCGFVDDHLDGRSMHGKSLENGKVYRPNENHRDC